MIIDAGQKKIGAQHCSTCDFLFSDDPSEQKAHNIRHARALGHIDFKGWKKENKIDYQAVLPLRCLLEKDTAKWNYLQMFEDHCDVSIIIPVS